MEIARINLSRFITCLLHCLLFLASDLKKEAVSYKIDDSAGSIGKRYTRTDEIAIPFAITVDFDSLEQPHTVTLRERDTTEQLRIPVSVLRTNF